MDHHISQDDKFGRVDITCGVLQGYIQVAVGPHHYHHLRWLVGTEIS